MFVRTADECNIFIEHAEHAYIYVCGQVGTSEMSDVEWTIGIWQCRCHDISLGGMDHNLCNRRAKVRKKQRAESIEHRAAESKVWHRVSLCSLLLALCCSMPYALCFYFLVPEAMNNMIIVHSYCLHECINDGGAHETESAFLEVFADSIADR